jgi:hypothetical protein
MKVFSMGAMIRHQARAVEDGNCRKDGRSRLGRAPDAPFVAAAR